MITATKFKNKDVVEVLCSNGADPNLLDDQNNTCLHWVATFDNAEIA